MSPKAFLIPLLLALAATGCVAPAKRDPRATPCAQPGWGRVLSPRETHMTVRAVEASARPTTTETRLGKPGWGRD